MLLHREEKNQAGSRMKEDCRRQCGQALIEFMIFLPLTLIFALSLVEIGMVFNTSQRVTNLAREAANTGLRLCGEEEPASLEACLRNNALPVLVDSVAPGTFKDFLTRGQIMISAYYWDEDTGVLAPGGCVSGGKSSACNSRFDTGSFLALDKSLGVIFVGECLVNYRSLMNLNFFTVPWEIYDYAVF